MKKVLLFLFVYVIVISGLRAQIKFVNEFLNVGGCKGTWHVWQRGGQYP